MKTPTTDKFFMTLGRIVLVMAVIGFLAVIFGAIFFIYSFRNFAGSRDPEYLKEVSNRINFGTFQCDNTAQWDTIQNRLHQFYIKHPAIQDPDTANAPSQTCNFCATVEYQFDFKDKPKEKYLVIFDMTSFNYIEKVYKKDDGMETGILTSTLDSLEKARILNRFNKEILTKINWDVKGINFK